MKNIVHTSAHPHTHAHIYDNVTKECFYFVADVLEIIVDDSPDECQA